MKNITKTLLVLASIVTISLTGHAQGLLGTSYGSLDVASTDFHQTGLNGSYGAVADVNQPLAGICGNAPIDLNLSYGWAQVNDKATYTQNATAFNLVGYCPAKATLKPFVQIGAGWIWDKTTSPVSTSRKNSFTVDAGAGVEWMATKNLAIRPEVVFIDATAWRRHNDLNYAVLASYNLQKGYFAQAGVGANDSADITYSVGVGRRF